MALELEITLAVVSTIATALGALQSAVASELQTKLAKWMLAKLRKQKDAELIAAGSQTGISISDIVVGDGNVVISVSDGTRIAHDHLQRRLEEIESARNKQQRLSRTFTWSSNLLT